MERIPDRAKVFRFNGLEEEMLGLGLTVGNAQWRNLGSVAAEDAVKWREYVEKARKEYVSGNNKLVVTILIAAAEIEKKWPTFDIVAGKMISAFITDI